MMFIDPYGMEAKPPALCASVDIQYSDGYSTQSNRASSGVVSFDGAYQNVVGDKPKVKSDWIKDPVSVYKFCL